MIQVDFKTICFKHFLFQSIFDGRLNQIYLYVLLESFCFSQFYGICDKVFLVCFRCLICVVTQNNDRGKMIISTAGSHISGRLTVKN